MPFGVAGAPAVQLVYLNVASVAAVHGGLHAKQRGLYRLYIGIADEDSRRCS